MMSDTNVFDETKLLEIPEQSMPIAMSTAECGPYISVNSIRGKVIDSAADEGYRRNWLRKVYDKLIYGAHMSNTVQTIVLRSQNGAIDKDVQVLCYGKINGGPVSFHTGADIYVQGKFDGKNRFIAKKMQVGSASVEIKTELSDVLVILIPLMLLFVPLIWESLVSAISNLESEWAWLIIPFIGGFTGAMHIIRKKCRYYIPFLHRVKVGVIVGIALALIFAIMF
jgi:hypothetical protein